MREIDYNYEYPIKALRFGKIELNLRKMRKDEIPDDGTTYYVEQDGSIYAEDEENLKLL